MKKLLLLFMLVPLTMSANFFDGTVKLTNGTSKTGLIEIPQAGDKTLKNQVLKWQFQFLFRLNQFPINVSFTVVTQNYSHMRTCEHANLT